MGEKSYHMDSDDFRRHGKEMIDWIADYWDSVESLPVRSQVQPGDLRRGLPQAPPQQPEGFQAIFKDLDELIVPGLTHWQSPNFFAYFPANTSAPAVLGDLLSAGLGVQGMLWSTSPACTELETHVLDWVADMIQLPQKFKSTSEGGGVIQDSASGAALVAVLAARERASDFTSNRQGTDASLVAYCSSQTHSSVEKAVKMAGMGSERLRVIAVDEDYAMCADALATQIKEDKAAGLTPCFVCATLGTTSSNALDPVPEIGAICREVNAWLHIDAAFAGNATVCPEYQYLHAGIEFADSYCFNPHKWLFVNFDCDCFYVADRKILIRTLSVLPEYLRNKATESGAVIDYRDWQISLGRRFRSLKLWFVLRHYGIEGLQHHVRRHIALAQEFKQWVKDSEDFEVVAPAPMSLVCFRHIAGDEYNEQLLETLNSSGKIFLTHTVLNGQYVLRFCVGQTHTEARHVADAWELIRTTAASLSISDLS